MIAPSCRTMTCGTTVCRKTILTASNTRRLPLALKPWLLLFIAAMMIAAFSGCSNSGSTANVTNPPPPPAAGISIAFQSAPPSALMVNAATPIAATVSNDSSNAGVDWVLTCQGGNCGTLLPPHTASGSPTTYTPPSILAGNTQIVNIQAFATADQTKNLLASINITAYGNNLSGTYVLAAQGSEGGTTYQFAGAIVLDGNGNVTSGQQTVNFLDPSTGSYTSYSVPIVASGSSYFLGADGRGTLTINPSNPTNDPSIGPETFSLVYLSSSQLLITATPNSILSVSASGTMNLQAASVTSALTGGYAFVVSGTDFEGYGQAGIGGIFNIDNVSGNPNNISGTGSAADQNITGYVTANQTLNGSITIPVAPGVLSLTLNFPNFSSGTPTITFAGYVIDQNHIQLIETDNGGYGSVAGLALGQGSATGTFSDASFSGTYVYDALGVDLYNGQPDTLTSVGTFTADGAGHLVNGFSDNVFQTLGQISGTFSASYSVATKGRVTSVFGSFVNPNNAFRPVVYFYLGGDGTALVLFNSDLNVLYPALANGNVYPQAAAPTLSGNYGVNFIQQNGTEYDGTAIMTAALPSLTGFADVGPSLDQGFSGTVSTQACSSVTVGCFPGSFTNSTGSSAFVGSNFSNPNLPVAFTADFYLIDSNHGFFIENDLLQQSQVSLGYFETATAPLAPSNAAFKKRKTR